MDLAFDFCSRLTAVPSPEPIAVRSPAMPISMSFEQIDQHRVIERERALRERLLAEHDQPHHVVRPPLDELAHHVLDHLEPVAAALDRPIGVEVERLHAARGVHHQHDVDALARHLGELAAGLWPRHGGDQQSDRRQAQRAHGAAQPERPRLPDPPRLGQGREPDRRGAAAAAPPPRQQRTRAPPTARRAERGSTAARDPRSSPRPNFDGPAHAASRAAGSTAAGSTRPAGSPRRSAEPSRGWRRSRRAAGGAPRTSPRRCRRGRRADRRRAPRRDRGSRGDRATP